MLRFDGTGPMGIESLTGRGLGHCAGYSPRSGIGFGRGHGRGFGRCFPFGFARQEISPEMQNELLKQHKAFLEQQIKLIDKQLEQK